MKKYYVYAHHRKSDGSLFYIGKGQRDRATSQRRNIYWKRIVAKHGFCVRYIQKNMTEVCALSFERALIAIHKSSLCNLTDGGEGTSGFSQKLSDETKAKIGKANRKPKPPGFGDAVRARCIGKRQMPEANAKRSTTMIGRHAGVKNPMHGRGGAKAPKYDNKEYRLYHPDHGIKTGTTYDIEAGLGYKNGSLRRLVRGIRPVAYGWRLA